MRGGQAVRDGLEGDEAGLVPEHGAPRRSVLVRLVYRRRPALPGVARGEAVGPCRAARQAGGDVSPTRRRPPRYRRTPHLLQEILFYTLAPAAWPREVCISRAKGYTAGGRNIGE